MHTFIVVLAIIVAILLVIVILLQNSKGAGLASGLSAAGSVQTLGVRQTADFLSKATSVLATAFMVLCIIAELTMPSSSDTVQKESVIQKNVPGVPSSSIPLPGDASGEVNTPSETGTPAE
ncbi:preprotein translocase, SecG subunit [Chloroherpeton thalassium ATCC 35110]|uniref:Protein-export membrane protein SecG n=1 Tax=Chloroherpeton thalassium (strain ATCC 35110 / GB-78) TaxID=517418 RepID=B3QTX0_CHLT3|nr:preprotein translocase subunit SecG [Chloroherpeton thalassium]ACF14318.1 preprotein translocase, SecG subunit [Chloroherpeton thalassium ATCC 35110]